MNRIAPLVLFASCLWLAPAEGAGRPAAAPPSFDQLDANGDGVLTPDELSGTPLATRFGAMDLDRNGRISRREYLSAMGLKSTGPATFELLDANHDGVVDRDEASVDPPLARQFEASDADGNGLLDRSEFSAFQAMLGASRGIDRP